MEKTIGIQINKIEAYKWDEGEFYFTRDIELCACIFCKKADVLIIDAVEINNTPPKEWPHAVHCGGCGARGPWARTRNEEDAVKAWNAALGFDSLNTPQSVTGFIPSDWENHKISTVALDSDDVPF